jgi:hypothetical protein
MRALAFNQFNGLCFTTGRELLIHKLMELLLPQCLRVTMIGQLRYTITNHAWNHMAGQHSSCV